MEKVVGALGKVSLAACGFASAICGKSTKESPGFFFAEPDCCLDSFSAKLKAVVGSPEGLVEEDTLLFLSEVFDRVVPTSTFIERAFARLNRWCDRKRPQAKTHHF